MDSIDDVRKEAELHIDLRQRVIDQHNGHCEEAIAQMAAMGVLRLATSTEGLPQ